MSATITGLSFCRIVQHTVLSSSEPLQKKQRTTLKESPELSSVFFKILKFITDKDNKELSEGNVYTLLADDCEVMTMMKNTPFSKINSQFNDFFAESNTTISQESFFNILRGLHQVSLHDESTMALLQKTAKELPELQKQADENILKVFSDSIELLTKAKAYRDANTIQKCITKINGLLTRLNNFDNLRKHTNSLENQRVLQLAILLKLQKNPQQYPAVIEEYPAIMKKATDLWKDSELISKHITKLDVLKSQLQII